MQSVDVVGIDREYLAVKGFRLRHAVLPMILQRRGERLLEIRGIGARRHVAERLLRGALVRVERHG